MGDEVYFVFAFEALRQLARAEGLNVPAPAKICGFGPEELLDVLDEVMGLASLWRLTEGARVLTF